MTLLTLLDLFFYAQMSVNLYLWCPNANFI